jgi:hypothetical protein
MSTSRPRKLSLALTRPLAAAVVVILAIMPAMPLVDAVWHTDDRCCAGGVCCCRPKPVASNWAMRAACRCGGHDEHEASLPTLPPFEVSARFGLAVPPSERAVAFVAVFSLHAGHLPPLDHPPGLLSADDC